MDKCKLGVISQERLKIEVKLLLSASRKFPDVDACNPQNLTDGSFSKHVFPKFRQISFQLFGVILLTEIQLVLVTARRDATRSQITLGRLFMN